METTLAKTADTARLSSVLTLRMTEDEPEAYAVWLQSYKDRFGDLPPGSAPAVHWVLAEERGRTLALSGLRYYVTPRTDRNGVFVTSLLCHPSFRGRRAMMTLVREGFKVLLHSGTHEIKAWVHQRNFPIIALLTDLGFRWQPVYRDPFYAAYPYLEMTYGW